MKKFFCCFLLLSFLLVVSSSFAFAEDPPPEVLYSYTLHPGERLICSRFDPQVFSFLDLSHPLLGFGSCTTNIFSVYCYSVDTRFLIGSTAPASVYNPYDFDVNVTSELGFVVDSLITSADSDLVFMMIEDGSSFAWNDPAVISFYALCSLNPETFLIESCDMRTTLNSDTHLDGPGVVVCLNTTYQSRFLAMDYNTSNNYYSPSFFLLPPWIRGEIKNFPVQMILEVGSPVLSVALLIFGILLSVLLIPRFLRLFQG